MIEISLKPGAVKRAIGKLGVFLIGAVVCIFMLFPFYFMITSSFKTSAEYMSPQPTFFPHDFSVFGYKTIFAKIDIFGRFFLNSVYVSVLIPLLQTVVCLPAAYALSRLNFRGKNLIFMLFVVAMMLPGQLTIIQNYRTIVKLKLINNLNSLVIISIFSPSCIFMMRQFFLGLPKELEEAGKIDGCNTFQNFLHIVAPLSVPHDCRKSDSVFQRRLGGLFCADDISQTTDGDDASGRSHRHYGGAEFSGPYGSDGRADHILYPRHDHLFYLSEKADFGDRQHGFEIIRRFYEENKEKARLQPADAECMFCGAACAVYGV